MAASPHKAWPETTTVSGPARVPGTVRLLTWNVWWRFGPWQSRQAAIAATLEAVDADVICLQEVWHDGRFPGEVGGVALRGGQAEVLAEPLGFDHRFATARGKGDVLFGNALLSRWPIAGAEVLVLPGGRRSALQVVLDRPRGAMPVICTHLDWEFSESELRQHQVVAIAESAARAGRETGTFPVVVCGDLNAVPDSEEIRALTGRCPPPVAGQVFTDAWEVAGDGPGWTVDRTNPWATDNAWPRRRIDYVLVAWPRPAKPVGNVAGAHLVGTGAVGGVVASDHYGVAVDLYAP